MELDAVRCYRALLSRDHRFDGRFFVGVVTTGIYCRPVCPAPTPKRQNVRFYACAAAAQAAGFRACRRCRPETAPGTPAWLGSSAVVSRALRLIADGALDDERDVEALATRVGMGARQLRRLFAAHIGASPAAIAAAQRVHFARRLLDETTLPITTVAYSAGFNSIRQFNHAVRATFGRSPSALRRERQHLAVEGDDRLIVRLPYRPPFDWNALLRFLALRAIPGVESVAGNSYRRTIEVDGASGTIEAWPLADQPCLLMAVQLSEFANLLHVVERARRLFDLDADPLQIAEHLSRSAGLARHLAAAPGLRVPGAWDRFELAVRAVLGQQVTVRGASTIAGRLVHAFGQPLAPPAGADLTHLFPAPAVLAEADFSAVGLPRARAATIRALAAAVAGGTLVLDAPLGLDDAVARLTAIPGIGAWTAQYIAMRACGEPDAFPTGDLGLRRALANGDGYISAARLDQLAEAWRPWRAYAAMHLWTNAGRAEPARGKAATEARRHRA